MLYEVITVTARRDDFWARIAANRRNGGAVPGAFEAWLLQRGLRTCGGGGDGPGRRRAGTGATVLSGSL